MKIGYKDDKRKIDFCKLEDGDLFEYNGDFYISTNAHEIDSCGDTETYNSVRLEDGSSCWFDAIDMVTPVEFVGYAKVREN